ncbi:uncharacterized protein LOC131676836 [Topomyia yanbarensis]|uniref:uncharacterized protein LOC131676836 n=1 Tax=Topomyia yanbarensis TaxID=2498891 RepID=UPI00273C338D|nr:uncharacterized protein LOC131676836 [Topomyia yanbarensis]
MEIKRASLWLGGLLQLILLLYCQPTAQAASGGINLFKDMLRGKVDEDECPAMLSADDIGETKFFLCRAPASSFSDLNLNGFYEKRTVNKYKNMMINKDAIEALAEEPEQSKEASRFLFPRVAPKRTPGAILSWAIPAANRV